MIDELLSLQLKAFMDWWLLFLYIVLFIVACVTIYVASDWFCDGLEDLSKLSHVSLPIIGKRPWPPSLPLSMACPWLVMATWLAILPLLSPFASHCLGLHSSQYLRHSFFFHPPCIFTVFLHHLRLRRHAYVCLRSFCHQRFTHSDLPVPLRFSLSRSLSPSLPRSPSFYLSLSVTL